MIDPLLLAHAQDVFRHWRVGTRGARCVLAMEANRSSSSIIPTDGTRRLGDAGRGSPIALLMGEFQNFADAFMFRLLHRNQRTHSGAKYPDILLIQTALAIDFAFRLAE